MKKMISVFFACLLLLVPVLVRAAPYEQRIEKFFALLQAGKNTEAVDYIYSGNPWLSRSSDAVRNVRTRMASINGMVGALLSHKKLQKYEVGGRFVYLSYLAVFERQPVRFEFEFYKPRDRWMIFSFALDGKLDDNIEEYAHSHLVR